MKIKSKKIKIIIISILAVCSIFIIAGLYFYQVAVVPGHKSFISNDTKLVKTDPLYKEKKWYQNAHKQKWVMKSADDNLKLDANYIPVANSKKTVIILHGFMNNKDTMGSYAAMFHKLDYNTLLPDARGHGQSRIEIQVLLFITQAEMWFLVMEMFLIMECLILARQRIMF